MVRSLKVAVESMAKLGSDNPVFALLFYGLAY